ncbi:MAG TPA: DUF2752 domain-containing protein [Longimicrobiaceae bacterium]|nr:DUF2752 domain-containing protein [Longimicrobiaceae bacterium]
MRVSVPRLLWPLAGAAGAAAAAVLYRFDPLQVGWYPRCVLFVVTGIYCPGCGALRAGHSLLHGHFLDALGYNPLLVLAAPILAYVLASRGAEAATGRRRLPRPPLSGRMARAIMWTFLLFAVLRNLPGAPFDLLRP